MCFVPCFNALKTLVINGEELVSTFGKFSLSLIKIADHKDSKLKIKENSNKADFLPE